MVSICYIVVLFTLIYIDAVKGIEASYDTARVSFPYIVLGETETMHNDHLRAHSCLSAAHTLSNDYLETEHVKCHMFTLLPTTY